MAVYYVLTARALDAFQLHADLGIQYYLARITAEGAVPLVDFEHGWNTASWYLSALYYRLADGNATAWLFLWGRTGFLFAGAALIVIMWRRRLRPAWIAGLTATWMLLTHVPHNKYATATVWVAVLLPAWGRRTATARVLRVGMAATVFWFHVELATLLAIGTALYDVFGERDGSWRDRLSTALHAPAGLAVGLASQVAVYAALGLAPAAFLSQAIGDWTVTEFGPLFDYPLGAPNTIRMALFPASVLVPFVPLLWRRLSGDVRLMALCHLALSLIAIRRPGDGHVASAGTLLALVLGLGALDLSRHDDALRAALRRAREWPRALPALATGALWYGIGLQTGFRTASLLAIVALTLVVLGSIVASRRDDLRLASVGALLTAAVVVVGATGNHLRLQVAADDALGETVLIADAIRGDVDRCVGPQRRAWVVTSPLPLYDELALSNPTPIYAFWYNLEAQAEELVAAMDAGEIPAIIQVTPWPESMTPIVDDIEARFDVCAQVGVESVNRQITVWTFRDGA